MEMGKFKKSIRFDSALFVIHITDRREILIFCFIGPLPALTMSAEIQVVYLKKLEKCSKSDSMHLN